MALKEEQIDKQRTFIRYGKIRGISHTFPITPKLRY
jgi:hypothetical protein